MRTIKHQLIGIFCLLSLCNSVWAQNILTASVDRNPVMVGETFTLTVTANNKVDNNQLDTSALLKQFVVGSTSVGSNTRIVNGEMSQQTSWNIRLTQRDAGKYTIPSFELNGARSAPIEVNVIEQPKTGATSTEQQDVKLVVNFGQKNAYVGQQLLYQVKLYIAAPLQRAQLQAPSLTGAEVTALGEDSDSTELLNGKRYRVITRHYNIRPMQPGDFELKGSVFRGDISLSQRTSFFNNGRSKPVTLIGDSQPFKVLPIPTDFPGQWLVSNHVALEDNWNDADAYRVGEPITRTITLTVADATQEQLPDVIASYPDTLKTYPDKKTTQQGLNQTTIVAQSVQKVAIIPSKAGMFIIPEIKLPWFDATSQKVRWATIPEKNINVLPAIDQAPTTVSPPVAPTATTVQTSTPTNNIEQQSTSQPDNKLWLWQTACAILLVIALVNGFIIFTLMKKRKIMPVIPSADIPMVERSLQQAINNKNIGGVCHLFPLWLNQTKQMDLAKLALVAPELAKSYNALIAQRYGNKESNNNVDTFSGYFSEFYSRKDNIVDDKLSGLYS